MNPSVAAWRREQRAALLARRDAISQEQRATAVAAIADGLDRLIDGSDCRTIGLFWPIRGEPNLIPWARALTRRAGIALCLPVVVEPKAPLEYWRWQPGDAMRAGHWNIPTPERREALQPDLVLAPLVGFDAANYRLGYGGGYFDRTLAVLDPRPFAVGVGFSLGRLETIDPQPHDIPMNAIITERPDSRTEEA